MALAFQAGVDNGSPEPYILLNNSKPTMKTFAIAISLFLLVGTLTAQPLTAPQRQVLDSLATRYLDDATPGVALGVVRGGEIVYEFYAGLADLDTQRPIGSDTRFNAASNGKQFTALCILELIDAGRLSLDTDIRTYLPELYPDITTPITIRHLLTHTSGIRDVYDLWSLQGITWWKVELDNSQALELLANQRDLNFAPGSDYAYSNSNYILLTEIVTAVTGQPFTAYAESLFTRLDMPHTAFLADHTKLPATVARPYFNFNEWVTYDWLSDLHGDGALFTTLPDQLRYEQLLQHSAAAAPSLTPLLDRSQQPVPEATTGQYGYGLEFGTYRDRSYRFHHGSTGAWKATTLRFPAEQFAIVVLNNSGKFFTDELADRVADVLLELGDNSGSAFPTGPDRLAGPLLSDAELLGTYQLGAGNFFRFVTRNDSLFLERPGRRPVQLERESGNLFHEIADPAFKQYFERDSLGRLQVTAYYPTHAPYTLTRLDLDWSSLDYGVLAGSYRNAELGTEITLSHRAEHHYLLKWRDRELSAEWFTPEQLVVEDAYRFTILQDQTGQVTELWLATSRSQGIRFVR